MANEQNLKKFTSDYQPKKNGRKKGSLNMTTILKRYLSGKIEGKELPAKDLVALKLIKKALEGDTNAMKYIFDRIDGKPTEKVETTNYNIDIEDAEKKISNKINNLNDRSNK
jgi:hypothetical protein